MDDDRVAQAEAVIRQQREALAAGDLERFLATFALQGHDRTALAAWFSGYSDPAPALVDARLLGVSGQGADGRISVRFVFSWPDFDDVTEDGSYAVSWLDSGTGSRIITFTLGRQLPPWPDPPDRTPVVMTPGWGPRVPARPLPTHHSVVLGAAAPPNGWPELGAAAVNITAVRGRPGIIRARVAARDDESLREAVAAVTGWLSQGSDRSAWSGRRIPGAPGADDWRQLTARMSPQSRRPDSAVFADRPQFSDRVPVPLLIRAVDRIPRYRQAHPELGPASIVAEMMSETSCKMAYRLNGPGAAASLSAINEWFSGRVAAGENFPRPPGVPRSDRRRLPWGGLDEALAIRDTYGQSRAACGTIAPVYAALLRLGGMDPFTVYTIDMPARLVTVVRMEHATYLVSNHGVLPMNPRTRYWSRTVLRLSTDAWYWDGDGATAAEQVIQRHRQHLGSSLPTFTVPAVAVTGHRSAYCPESIHGHPSPAALACSIRRFVDAQAAAQPASHYVWARYAFQTLRVAHPHVYLLAGIQTEDVDAICTDIGSVGDMVAWADTLGRQSIFPEPDRLMTPDQVIRYRRGRPADVACALAAIASARFGMNPIVWLSGDDACIKLADGWLRVSDMITVNAPAGDPDAVWTAGAGWTRWSASPLPAELFGSVQL